MSVNAKSVLVEYILVNKDEVYQELDTLESKLHYQDHYHHSMDNIKCPA